jgi:hypothetical protein
MCSVASNIHMLFFPLPFFLGTVVELFSLCLTVHELNCSIRYLQQTLRPPKTSYIVGPSMMFQLPFPSQGKKVIDVEMLTNEWHDVLTLWWRPWNGSLAVSTSLPLPCHWTYLIVANSQPRTAAQNVATPQISLPHGWRNIAAGNSLVAVHASPWISIARCWEPAVSEDVATD